ncbi:MAG: InlB B-repeat-containing protein, partial [Limisphaerales bacterium]
VYGSTNTLVAIPSQGYLFSHWSENGVQIGVSTQLVVVVKSNRVVVANYSEANPIHYVTTATVPPGIATVAGGGTYSNGQVAAISAPLSITNPPYIYRFKEFKLNGVFLNNSNAFSKIFSTLDPSNMNYVAYYDPSSILPVVTNTLMSHQAPVPATSNFVLTLQFDRVMNANVAPLIAVTNPGAAAQAVFSQIGYWTNRAASNDTFVLPGIVFGAGTDGTNYVYVSGAIDTNGLAIEATNILKFVVDATPPAAPTLVLSGSNSVSATVSWQGYVAPQDLAGFRVYISTNNFNSVAGLNNVAWLSASVRSYTYYNLKLDTTYYVAVVAVDVAGNAIQEVTPLSFILRPALPPSVAITVTSVGADSARISWQNYSTSELIGFNGFKLYYETNNFGNVSGLTARQVLGVNDRSVVVSNLNRLATYYFAVVGVNINGECNPLVTTMSWQDPYAGIITNNLTIGEVGQELIIYKPIIITNGATATIPPRTTLRFMPGTKIVVEQGAINASGSALDPIILTSANDIDGGMPQAGDWGGVELRAGAGGSVLRHIFIKYGNGLTINGCAPTIEALTTVYNGVAGLAVLGNATLNTKDGLIAYNAAGLVAGAGATVFITNSVIKNNLTNAVNQGAAVFTAVKNWWGSADLSDITNTISGSVNYSEYLL